jgi:hypothetical protein
MMSWKTILGLIIFGVLSVIIYSYYRLKIFSDDIYIQLARAGVRSISVVTLVRPQDVSDESHYWIEQSTKFSEQLIEGSQGLPLKINISFWTPSKMSSNDKNLFTIKSATIVDQTRAIPPSESNNFPSWLLDYPDSNLTYNFLKIWALRNKSDLIFFLDPRGLSRNSKDSNALLHTIAASVHGICLTNKIFQYLIIPQKNERANGVILINKHLILSTEDLPQPETLSDLMLSRLEQSHAIIQKIFERDDKLKTSSFESYKDFIDKRLELYMQHPHIPLQEPVLVSWISGSSLLSQYRMDYNFGDLYSQIIPQNDKKISKNDEYYWSINLIKEYVGPDIDVTPLVSFLLLEQDLHHINTQTPQELLTALQNYREEIEKGLADNQLKIVKEFKNKLFAAETTL